MATTTSRRSTSSFLRRRFRGSNRTRSSRASARLWTSTSATRKPGHAVAACYGMRYREYWDVDQKAFAFRQTEFEFQQYLPVLQQGPRRGAARRRGAVVPERRQSAARCTCSRCSAATTTCAALGDIASATTTPSISASNIAGTRRATSRWRRFVDAGKVVPLKRDTVDVSRLNYSGGIGFRVRVRSAIVSRTDFAVSREGFRIDLDLQRHLQDAGGNPDEVSESFSRSSFWLRRSASGVGAGPTFLSRRSAPRRTHAAAGGRRQRASAERGARATQQHAEEDRRAPSRRRRDPGQGGEYARRGDGRRLVCQPSCGTPDDDRRTATGSRQRQSTRWPVRPGRSSS